MQNYVNPYLFQQPTYQPAYQPQITPNYQQPTINAKLIDNIDGITANDVPMMGLSVFPKKDLSEVYIKQWLPNGSIQTLTYKAVVNEGVDKLSNDNVDGAKWAPYEVVEGVLERLDSVEEQIKSLSRPKTKKEVTE